MDPKKIHHGVIIHFDPDEGPPPPYLVPHILQACRAKKAYEDVLFLTIHVLLQALLLAILQLNLRIILMSVLGTLLLITAMRGLGKWRRFKDLRLAIKEGPPKSP